MEASHLFISRFTSASLTRRTPAVKLQLNSERLGPFMPNWSYYHPCCVWTWTQVCYLWSTSILRALDRQSRVLGHFCQTFFRFPTSCGTSGLQTFCDTFQEALSDLSWSAVGPTKLATRTTEMVSRRSLLDSFTKLTGNLDSSSCQECEVIFAGRLSSHGWP